MEGDANVALAEANLKTAENTLATLEEGPDPYEIMLAEAQVSNAQAQLEAAKEDLENATMLAPIDGTILTVEAKAGELVGTATVITLGDLDHPMLEVLMDESDLGNIKVGYECDVIFDAFPDETYPAVVTQVDPQLTTVGNTNAVRAEVQLDAAYIPASVTFPIGLNALVDVIGGKTENAVLVPVEALREIDTDEYAVFVLVDGEPELRMVEVGLMDYTYAEILSGVEAGETVTTGIVETN
jgi:RND family efflux transporter MFP subunit